MGTYLAKNFYISRASILPWDWPDRFFAEPDDIESIKLALRDITENSCIMEAILCASESLYQSIITLDYHKKKSVVKVYDAVMKYIIRAASRTTPFGLFVGISKGHFEANTNVLIDFSKAVKKAKPDMGWLYKVIQSLQADYSVTERLKCQINGACYMAGARLINPHLTMDATTGSPRPSVSIQYTKALQLLYEKCRNRKFTVKELMQSLQKWFPKTPQVTMTSFIQQLVANEVLLTELRMPLFNTDTLACLIEALSRADVNSDIGESLQKVQQALNDFNLSKPGAGVKTFDALIRQMSSISKSHHYIALDLGLPSKNNALSFQVADELERVANFLVNTFQGYFINDALENYYDKFVGKYGYSREVSIGEMLDIDIGIGAPAGYLHPQSQYAMINSGAETKFKSLVAEVLHNKLAALRPGEIEIILSDEDFAHVVAQNNTGRPKQEPLGIELAFILHNTSAIDNDNGRLLIELTPVKGSSSPIKINGRFTEMIEYESIDKLYQDIQDCAIADGAVLVEAHEQPAFERYANLCRNHSRNEYHLSIGTSAPDDAANIECSDIFVGADSSTKQFYLYSRSLKKRIMLLVPTMLNSNMYSNILRFAQEVTEGGNWGFLCFLNDIHNYFGTFSPRVVYSKSILVPAQWVLKSDDFPHCATASDFTNIFSAWRCKWNIPAHVYVGDVDQRLHLNITHKHAVEIIFGHYKARRPVVFTECNGENACFKDTAGYAHLTEFVVPLLRSKQTGEKNASVVTAMTTKSDTRENARQKRIDSSEKNIFFDENGWWYFKLYYGSINPNDLVLKYLIPFCEQMLKENIIEKYFFIRYADPLPHIRLRVKRIESGDMGQFIGGVAAWEREARSSLAINDICVVPYEREIERYGGETVMPLVEEYFFRDSRFVALLLGHIERFPADKEYVIISTVISSLRAMAYSETQMSVLLHPFSAANKNYQKRYMNCVKVQEQEQFLSEYPTLKDAICLRAEALRKYWLMVSEKDNALELTSTKDEIALSIVHMFCNRIMGNVDMERNIMELAEQAVHSYLEFIKHTCYHVGGHVSALPH